MNLAERRQKLEELSALFANPRTWIQDHEAEGPDGEDIPATHQKAQCWCLLGGIIKVSGGRLSPSFDHLTVVIADSIRAEFPDFTSSLGFDNADEGTYTPEALITQFNDSFSRERSDILQVLGSAYLVLT